MWDLSSGGTWRAADGSIASLTRCTAREQRRHDVDPRPRHVDPIALTDPWTGSEQALARAHLSFEHVSRRIASQIDRRLAGLEAPFVDFQGLDLLLQRRRRHTEPDRGAERPGHPALAVLECGLDRDLFVGRQRAGGETGGLGNRREPGERTSEPPYIDRVAHAVRDDAMTTDGTPSRPSKLAVATEVIRSRQTDRFGMRSSRP